MTRKRDVDGRGGGVKDMKYSKYFWKGARAAIIGAIIGAVASVIILKLISL